MINQFTKDMKPALSADRKPRKQNNPWLMRWTLAVTVIGITLFCAVCARIYFQAEIENLSRRSAQLDVQIEREQYALENLKSRKEALCSWNSIRQKMISYKLPLRPRQPNQVAYLKRFKGEKSVAVTEGQKETSKEEYTYHSAR